MQTDLPLKRLTQLRPHDLLPLLGSPAAEVVAVESLELPASKTSLDTVLRLRHPDGREYLHLIEWQGYRDPQFLWRTLGYLSWLGQNRPERPILVTIIYLHYGDDIGDNLIQELPGVQKWAIGLPCIRLWQLDAARALADRTPGLAALSPLMDRITPEQIAQAAEIILHEAPPPQQDELLTVLGVFAGERMDPERLERLIGKERVMASAFIQHIFKEEFAEQQRNMAELEQRAAEALQRVAEQERRAAEQERRAAEQERRAAEALQRAAEQERQNRVSLLADQAEEAAILRFPDLPARAIFPIRALTDAERLRELHRALLAAPDQAAAERLLADLPAR